MTEELDHVHGHSRNEAGKVRERRGLPVLGREQNGEDLFVQKLLVGKRLVAEAVKVAGLPVRVVLLPPLDLSLGKEVGELLFGIFHVLLDRGEEEGGRLLHVHWRSLPVPVERSKSELCRRKTLFCRESVVMQSLLVRLLNL